MVEVGGCMQVKAEDQLIGFAHNQEIMVACTDVLVIIEVGGTNLGCVLGNIQ